MNYKTTTSFFILFVLKDLLPIQSAPASSYQFDITKALDQWFSKLFTIDLNAIKVRESFFAAEHYILANVEYNFNKEIQPFRKKIHFQDVKIYQQWNDRDGTTRASQMSWNFPKNKINITLDKFRITVSTKIRSSSSEPGFTIYTTLNFRNFTLGATAPSTNNKNISYDISYDHYYLYNADQEGEIKWSQEYDGTLRLNKTEELAKEIKSALVALLLENIKRNENFMRAFDELFTIYTQNRKEIISTHPGFSNQEQKYYYLIPKIPFYRFVLNSILIKGLSNVESLKVYNSPDIFTHSLLIKHVRGNLILDYGSQYKEAPESLELNFRVDYLTISIRHKVNCAHVEAKFYEFNSTKGPLSYRQSTILMQSIESALVSAIVPSKEAWRVCDIKLPIDESKIIDSTSEPNWEKIKEVYNEWIPFPETDVVKISK